MSQLQARYDLLRNGVTFPPILLPTKTRAHRSRPIFGIPNIAPAGIPPGSPYIVISPT